MSCSCSSVRIEGCCQSMRCLLTLLRSDLCQTTFCSTNMGRCSLDESDGHDDVDRMDDMVANTGRGYDLESKAPPPEVQNFYKLFDASEEKVHDGTDATVL
jgi:hypothetical protein